MKQSDLALPQVAKWLCDDREPRLEDLKLLAQALESTSDYIIGLGDSYGENFDLAAAKMSFAYFKQDVRVSADQKRNCARIFDREDLLLRKGAPRTASEWMALAEMIDVAIGPRPTQISDAKRQA